MSYIYRIAQVRLHDACPPLPLGPRDNISNVSPDLYLARPAAGGDAAAWAARHTHGLAFRERRKKCGHSRAINKSRRITTTQSVAAPDRHDSMVQTDSARLAKHTRRQYKQAARRVRLVGGGWESRGVRGDAQVARRPFFEKKKIACESRGALYHEHGVLARTSSCCALWEGSDVVTTPAV